jgi:hypothetical protein
MRSMRSMRGDVTGRRDTTHVRSSWRAFVRWEIVLPLQNLRFVKLSCQFGFLV